MSGPLTKYENSVAINVGATATLVAAVADRSIIVTGLFVMHTVATASHTLSFNSGAGGTPLTGIFIPSAVIGEIVINPGHNPKGWFRTAKGALLEIATGGSSPAFDGWLTYFIA